MLIKITYEQTKYDYFSLLEAELVDSTDGFRTNRLTPGAYHEDNWYTANSTTRTMIVDLNVYDELSGPVFKEGLSRVIRSGVNQIKIKQYITKL